MFGRWFGVRSPKRNSRAGRGQYRPWLETLEDRLVPSTIPVTNKLDSGPGSLRQAIIDANGNPGADTIVFDKGVSGTIKLTSGEMLITDSVTISGPGANKLAVSGNDISRIFDVAAGLNVAINGLTITHGSPSVRGSRPQMW
jgi:hypothetical protein